MFYINPSIYNKTLLEGLPFTLKYCETRPKFTYNINSGRPMLSNFRDWHNLKENVPLYKMQKLFLHDTSHAILYFIRNEKHRLFKNDFGLSWNNVKWIEEYHLHFKKENERLDEYKVSSIYGILISSIKKNGLPTIKQNIEIIYGDSYYLWHTANSITSKIEKEKRMEIEKAVDYVYNDIGPVAIRDAARSFIKYMKEQLE